MKMRVKRPSITGDCRFLFSSLSFSFPAPRCFQWSKCWRGPLWEELWSYVCVLEILQLHVAAQAWNNASKYGPYCELFAGRWQGGWLLAFLLLRTDSRSTEPYGGKTRGIRAQGESIALEECQGWPLGVS